MEGQDGLEAPPEARAAPTAGTGATSFLSLSSSLISTPRRGEEPEATAPVDKICHKELLDRMFAGHKMKE
jgi:hypothetical protein